MGSLVGHLIVRRVFFYALLLLFFGLILDLFFDFSPSVPQGDGAIENRLLRRGFLTVDTEISQSFKLKSTAWGSCSQAGFQFAPRQNL